MQCNIDNRGAQARQIYGIMALLVAAMLAILNLWGHIWWLWILVAAMAAAGVFCLFEARKKWCAMRSLTGRSSADRG